jgi:hypothetical protein
VATKEKKSESSTSGLELGLGMKTSRAAGGGAELHESTNVSSPSTVHRGSRRNATFVQAGS